ncbi:MAG: hypothetical protein OEX02_14485 [Cyclobacteriaceae bacterium]|nr:hypothetical protein [Cyclobacteriaceae bacterium]
MKRTLTVLLLILAVGLAQAQKGEKDNHNNHHRIRTYKDFKLDLGLNNYLIKDKFPDATGEIYTLKPIGSWYVALGRVYRSYLNRNLYMEWGGDVSWYNFKFEEASTILTKFPDRVEFSTESRMDYQSQKSKLAVTYVNASIVPMVKLGKSRKSLRIGAGVYGGYKVDSYTRYVYNFNGQKVKDRIHSSYFIENLRYGFRGRLGYRDFDLFANYDMNTLFTPGKGPELNPVSVGICFLDL